MFFLLHKISHGLTRKPKLVVLIALLLLIPSLIGMAATRINYDILTYLPPRPAIGISGKTLPNAALAYYRLPTGVYVETVDPSSDAYAKGIQEGDIITAIEDTAVTSMDDLNMVKNQYQAADEFCAHRIQCTAL